MSTESKNLENTACVVLSGSDSTLADIKTSLGLLKMEVRGAKSSPDIRAELVSGAPPIIAMVELDLPGKEGEGSKVAQSIKTHPTLNEIPVCLLIQDYEEGDPVPEPFDGAFKLPVEFPSFTRQVKKFFEEFDPSDIRPASDDLPQLSTAIEAPVAGSIPPVRPVSVDEDNDESGGEALNGSHASVDKGGKVPSSHSDVGGPNAKGAAARFLERRMIIAYGVQLAVLEALERDQTFASASIEEIPNLISKITEKVAAEFDFRSLLDDSTEDGKQEAGEATPLPGRIS